MNRDETVRQGRRILVGYLLVSAVLAWSVGTARGEEPVQPAPTCDELQMEREALSMCAQDLSCGGKTIQFYRHAVLVSVAAEAVCRAEEAAVTGEQRQPWAARSAK